MIKMVKGKRKNDPPRPAARQKKPGMPKWYKDLFQTNNAPINITVRTRIAPLLLRLAWDGHPLFWSDKHGWTFRVPRAEASKYTAKQMIECKFDEKEIHLRDDHAHTYAVEERLIGLTDKALEIKDKPEAYTNDPWKVK